jgi:FSR family fosmidomycin resistance protein-like MFS transporter
MSNRAVFRLILLISCAHALVHTYELALPSVEQKIAADFSDDQQQGKALSGRLSNYWRLMWGFGAPLAGLLVDRFGGRRMLAVYLLGCAATCVLTSASSSLAMLYGAMIGMGAAASIYHPAGLALISHVTTPENRPRAMGLHGILGSAGIALGPLLAALVLVLGFGWREYYVVLAVPGVLLGLYFVTHSKQDKEDREGKTVSLSASDEEDQSKWASFVALTTLAFLQGFVYSAVMSFMTRYLSAWQPSWASGFEDTIDRFATGGVLLIGCVGQFAAGRFARSRLLERQLTAVTFANSPLLLLMAFAPDNLRIPAAGLFALVHFMHQPLYNSLVATYTPRRSRSLCYGLSFAAAFGLGSFGSRFAGNHQDDVFIYCVLAGASALAGCVGIALSVMNRGKLS